MTPPLKAAKVSSQIREITMNKQVEALVQISQIVLKFNNASGPLAIDATVEKCSEVFGYVTLGDRLQSRLELYKRLVPVEV